jgi:PfpI family intracellular protease
MESASSAKRGPSRRQFIKLAAGGTLGVATLPTLLRARPPAPEGMSLGFGLYGMPSIPPETAIPTLAEIGFDSVQLCLIPGWDCEPGRLGAERRRDIRKSLDESGLALPSLMEHVPLGGDAGVQRDALERLRRAAELAHGLAPERPPLIETVMGGSRWEDERAGFRDHLGRWAALAESVRTVIAVKPHRGHACSRPEDALWLVDQVGSPWIKLVYDYSHFDHRDILPGDSLAAMLPHTAQIAVKDADLRDGAVSFTLPGTTGRIDHAALLRQAFAGGYRGDVNCEVSSHVQRRAGYDAEAAARTCYATMALAFREAGIPRNRGKEQQMPKVLMPIGDATEMMDTLYPFFRLPEDGFEVVVAGPEARLYNGVAHEVPPNATVPWDITEERPSYHIQATVAFRDVKPEDYAGLFLSGGRAPEYLRYDKDLLRITRHFTEKNKPIAVVCHGIEILAAAGGLQGGRRATTVAKCEFDITQNGGEYVKQRCVIDGNIVSAGTWHDYGTEFFKVFIQKMREAS